MAAEASPDAQTPVTLALMKLAAMYGLDWLNNVSLSRITSRIELPSIPACEIIISC